jgi:hypothetical protein
MGVKTALAGIVPANTHTAAAQALGHDAANLLLQVQTHLIEDINLIKQVISDMTKGNPSDPGIATLNTQVTNLS